MTNRVDIKAIADALGASNSGAAYRAKRESWPFEEISGRGGKKRLYPLVSLPKAVREAIACYQIKGSDAPKTVVKTEKAARALPCSIVPADPESCTAQQRDEEHARRIVLRKLDELMQASGSSREAAMITLLTMASAGTLGESLCATLRLARDARGRKGNEYPSVRSLKRWIAKDKVGDLMPKITQPDMKIQPWHALAIALRQRPQGSTLTWLHEQIEQQWDTSWGDSVPSYHAVRRFFADKSRFKIGMFARQTGKTFTTTLEIADDMFEAEALGQRRRWVILSRGERQAKEAMEEGIKKHCKAYNLAIQEVESGFRGADGTTYTQLDAVLPGGSKVTALPANPDTARGFSANVFLDEFAFHADSRKIWSALFPVISNGYKLRVTSTPNGKGNKFYDLMTGADGTWSRHLVDIYQAVKDGLPRDVNELRAALDDDDAWAQEYELKWMDEASAWLSFELINSCEHDSAGQRSHYQGGPCYVGVDIAARNDLFVIWVAELVGDVLWTREIITRRRIKFAEQDALLDEVFAHYRVIRCCIDQTGMGEKPVEDAQRRHGSMRVEGVLFTASNKLTMATQGKELFEDRRLRIPLGDAALRADLHKLQKVTGPTGTPRFEADSDSTGHADRTWACFLACNAASTPSVKIEYQSIGKLRSTSRMSDFLGI